MGKIRSALTILLAGYLAAFIWGCGKETVTPQVKSKSAAQLKGYSGSKSCRECHERFYKLWAPSYHGLAMQPFSPELAKRQLLTQKDVIEIGKYTYRAEFEIGKGWVRESGPDSEQKYPIQHVLGGKNVYYFLTPLERGRLQVLPIAYDVRKKEWFDTTGSAIRHFANRRDEALDWKEWPLTFNTSCYRCHVSQLSTNYDLDTDTYHTVWVEPGINCETCHGPSGEHVRVCQKVPKGHAPKDLKIIRPKKFSPEQRNAMCGPCHAKMIPLTTNFLPGDGFFDHYDLVTLEHSDFYPDGRDLGENYTYTLWLTSPCVKSGQLDCIHCHSPSGRYKFKGVQTNNACLPCHKEHVKNAAAHSHHSTDSDGSKCVSCHMPMTEFARMRRSDHSMRPPTPSATIRFNSPNACNICHTDRDAVWADKLVREWRVRDYQAPVLHRAGLIDTARKRDWSQLPEMLDYITSESRDEVYATSLIRLLRACEDEAKWPVILKALQDKSPLVRASAAGALAGYFTPESISALLEAARDDYRLVRVRAGAALAGFPLEKLNSRERETIKHARSEFIYAMKSRPDDFTSHYNLGNFYMDQNEIERAIGSFETAVKIQPNNVVPLVNLSMAYAIAGRTAKAEKCLVAALKVEPDNLAVNLNLGLLLGEQGRMDEAEAFLRTALKQEPTSAVAAYNLSVILAKDRVEEAIRWCREAGRLRPDKPEYAYTLAFYLWKKGDAGSAIQTLQRIVDQQTPYVSAYALLGEIYKEQGRTEAAIGVYRQALENEKLPQRERQGFAAKIKVLSSR